MKIGEIGRAEACLWNDSNLLVIFHRPQLNQNITVRTSSLKQRTCRVHVLAAIGVVDEVSSRVWRPLMARFASTHGAEQDMSEINMPQDRLAGQWGNHTAVQDKCSPAARCIGIHTIGDRPVDACLRLARALGIAVYSSGNLWWR